MESKTEDFIVQLEAGDVPATRLRSFQLFEEYCHEDIATMIESRRERFERADVETRRLMELQTHDEIRDFCSWLQETKEFTPRTAHYYSISLKSLLLGLPIGVQIAHIFNVILAGHAEE
jgi:hypothetical protein